MLTSTQERTLLLSNRNATTPLLLPLRLLLIFAPPQEERLSLRQGTVMRSTEGTSTAPTRNALTSTNAQLKIAEVTTRNTTIPQLAASPTLPTPLRLNNFKLLLHAYYDKEFIVHGVEFGFRLGFTGKHSAVSCSNSPSLLSNMQAGVDKVNQEIEKGRIAGPFTDVPFPYFKCSPLALRPKPDGKVL